jgi:N-acetylglucosamine-6-phosphate deacetylase
MQIRGRHYATGQRIDITFQKGAIRQIHPAGTSPPDVDAGWIAPAWFDIQINGALGIGLTSTTLTDEQLGRVVDVCRAHGIGEFCPTIVTNSFEVMRQSFLSLERSRAEGGQLARAMPYFHLEGPYISAEDGPRGAHPKEHVRTPELAEFQRLQEAAGGRIRLVTLAPELPGALTFIEKLSGSGVVVAIGHTAATAQLIRDAVAAGVRMSTHLGNGTHALLPRHDNYVWEQLADDRLWASVICDGAHLPASVVRCLLRVKTPARTVLTCDSSPLAGLPPGIYREWGQEFEVLPEERIVVRSSGFLAGSWAFTDRCIANAVRFAGVSLRDAVEMATVRPRQLLGLPPAALEAGSAGPLVLFDWEEGGDLMVQRVVGNDES